MAKMLEEYCTRMLGEYAKQGFTAHEDDDHFLVVEHYGEEIARFNANKITITKMQLACHQHLNKDVVAGELAQDEGVDWQEETRQLFSYLIEQRGLTRTNAVALIRLIAMAFKGKENES